MHIALLTDIHGNREALSACLEHAERSGAERYVFLGDYAGYGADPGWVIDTVMAHVERGAVAVLGNHDEAALGAGSIEMNDNAAAAIEWTREHITATHRDFLDKLPMTVEDKNRLYVHASADDPGAWNYVTGLHAAAKSLMATKAQATFCGHTHVPTLFHMSATGKFASFDPIDRVEIPLTRQRRWLAVIGSVGQPRDRDPSACYAMLDDSRELLTYFRVPYDVETAARKIIDAGLPPVLGQRLFEGY
jgi:diadenosine tetraphosphatase ApaH/serine/threonine PP2A family protein phosphatase